MPDELLLEMGAFFIDSSIVHCVSFVLASLISLEDNYGFNWRQCNFKQCILHSD